MTDELTPEERRAIDGLPRERMPSGLEGRVVEAMRESGFLAPRRRAIELTNGRIAGLLAACVALVIGAYSIGLHRGDDSRLREIVDTAKLNESGRTDIPPASHEASELAMEKAPQPTQTPLRKDEADQKATSELDRSEETESKKEIATSDAPSTPAPLAEAQEEASAARERDVAQSITAKAPTPPAARMSQSAGRMQASLGDAAAKPTLTFVMDGSTWIVEAPDSVRVVQDEEGRMLLIYTSDGVIRIRLADAR